MTDGPKVIQLRREGWREAVQALKAIVDQVESGELPPIDVGVLVTMSQDGEVEVFGIGPKAEALQVVGLLRYGEHRIVGR